MIRISLILLLLTLGTYAKSQSTPIRGKQNILKGRIINEVNLTPSCGYIAWGTVVEFEIIEYSDKTYKERHLGLVISCPEFYKDNFFVVGKEYEIKVVDENQADFEWTIPNKEKLKKYPLKSTLWAIDVKRLKD